MIYLIVGLVGFALGYLFHWLFAKRLAAKIASETVKLAGKV